MSCSESTRWMQLESLQYLQRFVRVFGVSYPPCLCPPPTGSREFSIWLIIFCTYRLRQNELYSHLPKRYLPHCLCFWAPEEAIITILVSSFDHLQTLILPSSFWVSLLSRLQVIFFIHIHFVWICRGGGGGYFPCIKLPLCWTKDPGMWTLWNLLRKQGCETVLHQCVGNSTWHRYGSIHWSYLLVLHQCRAKSWEC
jgi:hypothetical protein